MFAFAIDIWFKFVANKKIFTSLAKCMKSGQLYSNLQYELWVSWEMLGGEKTNNPALLTPPRTARTVSTLVEK